MKEGKKLQWYNLSLMVFVSVWGVGNVVNNYANQGLHVIFSWLIIFAIYFVPYALMVGEMGATFKNSKGGVASWIKETMTPQMAFFTGWIYWVVHVPYLAQKPQLVLVAAGWIVLQNGDLAKMFNPVVLQFMVLGIFFLFMFIASRGLSYIKVLGSIAGSAMFIMSILFIIMGVTAPAITDMKVASTNLGFSSFVPNFDFTYFTTISMLVFAVGGCEKLSPYAGSMAEKNGYSKGMIIVALMIAISAILGSVAMGMMFDTNNIPKDLKMNGQFYIFQKLDNYYRTGNLFLIIYAMTQFLSQAAVLAISIDAPLRIFLADTDAKFVPKKLLKTNNNGVPINGYFMTAILVGVMIMLPTLGIKDMNSLYSWLLDLNSIVMPMRYLFVFLAYFMLKKHIDKFTNNGYKFIKNNSFGKIVATWCFIFTSFSCIMGIFPKSNVAPNSPDWYFQLAMNIGTPFILVALGFIVWYFAKNSKN